MKTYKFKLRKVKPCVYGVWYVDRNGVLGSPLGEVGKYSALCKYDDFFVNDPMFQGIADKQWVFYSPFYEIRVFDDYISAFRYARLPGSGA